MVFICARSSVVERYSYKVEVAGSIPAVRNPYMAEEKEPKISKSFWQEMVGGFLGIKIWIM